MRYHLVLMSSRNSATDPHSLRDEINELRAELRSTLSKLHKQDHGNCTTLFYLPDESSVQDLFSRLHDHDELVIHAEGFPFMIGFLSSNEYNLTAFQLAAAFNKHRMPDVKINLNILTCNSATELNGINFARDLSTALNVSFKYQHITVIGYTGYVVVKSNAKYSVSSLINRTEKGSHAALEDARNVYRNGHLLSRGRVMCDFTYFDFSWAAESIRKVKREQSMIHANPTHSISNTNGLLFHTQNTPIREQDGSEKIDTSNNPTPGQLS